MPSCIIAFHVTCAFDHGLEMRTTLAENDEVRFKSFCLEHSSGSHSSSTAGNSERSELRHPGPDLTGTQYDRARQDQAEREKASQRKQKLQELQDEFYKLVDPKDVAESLCLPDAHVDFLYQYWKLRRKANSNQPLVELKRDEVDNLAQQEQDVLYRRLKLFTHLRQDLERVSIAVLSRTFACWLVEASPYCSFAYLLTYLRRFVAILYFGMKSNPKSPTAQYWFMKPPLKHKLHCISL